MSYAYFATYNVVGGITWVITFTLLGYFFGNIPFVRKNFELVIIAIILISVMPMFFEWWKARREKKVENATAVTPTE
jgi:membrane-associated protein